MELNARVMDKNVRKEIKDRISKIEGANLRRLREDRGWTQEQLAEKAETNTKHISPIERGKRGIGVDLMTRFCSVFGVDELEFRKEGSAFCGYWIFSNVAVYLRG